MDTKSLVCEILNIPARYASEFELLQQEKGIVLLQYRDNANMQDPITRTLRGVVIDLINKTTLSTTSVYSVKVDQDELEVDGDDLVFVTEFSEERRIPLANVQISPHRSGAKLTFMLHDGEIYIMTHKNLHAEGQVLHNERGELHKGAARFGHGMPFVDMLRDLVGDLEVFKRKLYPAGCLNSPYIYSFYIDHPSLRFATTIETSDIGYLVFFGAYPMWSLDNDSSPFDWNNDEEDPRPKVGTPHLEPTDFEGPSRFPYDEERPGGFVLVPGQDSISVQEANNVLFYGVPEPTQVYQKVCDARRQAGVDPRLFHSESIIVIYTPDDPDAVPEHFHIRSQAYKYRNGLHEDIPNQYLAFTRLIEQAYKPMKVEANREAIRKAVPPVRAPSRELVEAVLAKRESIDFADLYTDEELAKLTRDQTMTMVAYAFLLATNPHMQKMAFKFYDRYIYDVTALARWIIKEKNATNYPRSFEGEALSDNDKAVFDYHVKRILRDARDRLAKNYGWMADQGKGQKRLTREQVLDQIIKDIVRAQHGENLYKMIRLMSRVTGHDSKRIADPTAPATTKRAFPVLGTSKAASSSQAPPKARSVISRASSSRSGTSTPSSGSELDEFILSLGSP